MPLYEYRCRQCDARFEVLQRLGDGAQGLVCPKCESSELSKQFSTFAAASSSEGSPTIGAGAPSCGSGFT